jgi:hypothetical protein
VPPLHACERDGGVLTQQRHPCHPTADPTPAIPRPHKNAYTARSKLETQSCPTLPAPQTPRAATDTPQHTASNTGAAAAAAATADSAPPSPQPHIRQRRGAGPRLTQQAAHAGSVGAVPLLAEPPRQAA